MLSSYIQSLSRRGAATGDLLQNYHNLLQNYHLFGTGVANPAFLWSHCCLLYISEISVPWFVIWTRKNTLYGSVPPGETAALGFQSCGWHDVPVV